ncbi:hypothetical protein DENIS_1389 [Desulfonema ishimotonii]|uniref:Uncharacterized protein n=1 Tax=Desulfonema ishimotonii TaxID=45657 RepID=A0A401FTX5_9BACT|nr:hypothetical protein [Desulfonema ishimotonii]GBC60437.1 hypothetical protein DENIS_1389 [Desulfonema ishimotonii]
MKDERGLYYHPFLHNTRIRMYIRKIEPDICFRMWNADDDKLWEEHGWVPYSAIQEASAIYEKKRGGLDPKAAYDIRVARVLVREDG